jgi:hypothetical protein
MPSTDSAVARTPVELWTEILSCLIDDSRAHPLCDPIEFEEYNYDSEHHHCFDSRLFGALREVCQSWKAIVEQHALIPQINFIMNMDRSQPYLSHASYLKLTWHQPPSSFPYISSALGAPPNRMIHIHLDLTPGSKLIREILDWVAGLPSLRGLCLRWDFDLAYQIPPNMPSMILSGTCTHLLSLDIGYFVPSPDPLSLPHLQSLVISFYLRIFSLEYYFLGWKLPSLVMFSLTVRPQQGFGGMDLNFFHPITKRVKTLFLHCVTHPNKVIESYPIDLEGTFPTLEYLFLCNMPLHLQKPVPPQHPLHTITFSSLSSAPVFYFSTLSPEKHKRQKLVKLYLKAEKSLLRYHDLLVKLRCAGIEALDGHRDHHIHVQVHF